MKNSLKPGEPAVKILLTAEEIREAERKVEALQRIGDAQDRDRRSGARSRILVGVAAVAGLVCLGGGTLFVMNKAEHAIFAEENPGGPQLSAEAPQSPLAPAPPKVSTDSGPKVSAYEAQQQVRKAMGAAGVAVLSTDRVSSFFPEGDSEALHAYLEKARTDYGREHRDVPKTLSAAAVNCSAFVTMSIITQAFPEQTMHSMVHSLNSKDWAASAAICETGAEQAMVEHSRFPSFNY